MPRLFPVKCSLRIQSPPQNMYLNMSIKKIFHFQFFCDAHSMLLYYRHHQLRCTRRFYPIIIIMGFLFNRNRIFGPFLGHHNVGGKIAFKNTSENHYFKKSSKFDFFYRITLCVTEWWGKYGQPVGIHDISAIISVYYME